MELIRVKRTRNLPFKVSLRWRSTALCVARRSAVFARREGFLLILFAVLMLLVLDLTALSPPSGLVLAVAVVS